MPYIENEFLKIEINTKGGALASIYDKKSNEELLYQPDKRSWMGQDVVIFPFVASLKDRRYLVDNQEYMLRNHGIIRYYELSCKQVSDCELIMYLDSNEDTLKEYPFKFHFEVKYSIDKNQLLIDYRVNNTDSKEMYFSLGGHPALKVSGIETEVEYKILDTTVIFNKDISTIRYVLNKEGNLISHVEECKLPCELVVSKELIDAAKTLIYDATEIDEVVLKTKNRKYKFDISKSKILAIWTLKGLGDYLCIEPWWGIPDFEQPELELKSKPLIMSLESGKEYCTGYSIIIE